MLVNNKGRGGLRCTQPVGRCPGACGQLAGLGVGVWGTGWWPAREMVARCRGLALPLPPIPLPSPPKAGQGGRGKTLGKKTGGGCFHYCVFFFLSLSIGCVKSALISRYNFFFFSPPPEAEVLQHFTLFWGGMKLGFPPVQSVHGGAAT